MPRLSAGAALVVCLTALLALPQTAGGYRLAKWGFLGLGVAALALGLLVRLRAHAPLSPLPRRAWLPPVVFVTAAVLLPTLSPSQAAAHVPLALVLLTGLAFFFVTTISLHHDVDAPRARRTSLVYLTAAGALCAMLVLLQAAGLRWMTEGVPSGLEFRAPGTFGNPNWAAAFLAPLAPLSLALGTTAHSDQERRLQRGVVTLLSLAVVATLSKDGALTLVAGVLVYLLLDRDAPARRRLLLLGVGMLGAVVLVLLAWQLDWLRSAPWLRGRWFVGQAALLLATQHPITGVGLGGFLPAYGKAAEQLVSADPDLFMPLSVVDVAHNDTLQFAAEGGFITATAFVIVVGSAVLLAYRIGSPLSRAAGAAIAALFVNGLADPPLRMPGTFALFFFLLGWLGAAASHSMTQAADAAHTETQTAHASSNSRHIWLPRFLLVASLVLGGVQGVRFVAGNLCWTFGRDGLDELRPIGPTLEHYEQARFFLPEHGRMAAEHAQALLRAGRLDEAIETSKAASALRFDWDDELFRADVRARQLDADAVFAMWREMAARYPMLLTPHLRLGRLYSETGDIAAAIEEYEAVLARPQPTRAGEAAHAQAANALRRLRGAEQPAEQRPKVHQRRPAGLARDVR